MATVLVANPFVFFLLTRSLQIAVAITALSIVAIQVAMARRAYRLVLVYLFNLLAVCSVFAHAEVLLVHAYPEHVVPNLYTIENGFYFNRPFLNQSFRTGEFNATYRTNAQGYRIGGAHDPARELAEVDWLVLGDSFTQGAQVEFEQLFTTQLNMRFPDKIILNAGISGAGIAQEYNYFVNAGYAKQPQLVILQLGNFNDFMNVEPKATGLTERLMAHSAFIRLLIARLNPDTAAELPLGRWTEPFQPDERANVDFNVFFKRRSEIKDRDLSAFAHYLELFKRAAEDRGARLMVVLLPTREQVDEASLEQVVSAFSVDRGDLDMELPNTYLRALTERLGITFLDLLPAFRRADGPLYFRQDEHLTAFGHFVVAEAIAEALRRTEPPSLSRLLSRELAGERYPMFSQDGSRVTYQSIQDSHMAVFIASPDFAERQRITFGDVDRSHPMLSRDNSRVLFTEGSADSFRTSVVLMNVDGSGREVLSRGPNLFGAIPTFSRSNAKVAFAEWAFDERQDRYSEPHIVVLDLASGQKKALPLPQAEHWRPVFAPDEEGLVYIAKRAGQFDLYLYDLVSATERRLTDTPFDEWDPQFSPDGEHVVYAARADGNWDLFLRHLPTANTLRLTQTRGDEWDPSFSPDGSRILFAGRFGHLEAIFQMPVPQ